MDRTFSETPTMFGAVHLMILGAIALGLVVLYFVLRKRSDKALVRVLFVLGLCMLIAEGLKQWFVHRYVYNGVRSMWFFPWQLCSMAMYVSTAVPILKGKARDAVLVFLCTYSVVGALVALVVPEDMLRPQIALFVHSFLYHAVMLAEALCAILLLTRRERVRFLPSLLLFVGMAAVAEGINLISHAIIPKLSNQANMFYITPFYPTTQPVFNWIAERCGILVEIVLYLGVIVAASYGLYRLWYAVFRKKQDRPD